MKISSTSKASQAASENDMSWAISYVVQEDYLKVMRFRSNADGSYRQDNEHSSHVIVIDDFFARKFFGIRTRLETRDSEW